MLILSLTFIRRTKLEPQQVKLCPEVAKRAVDTPTLKINFQLILQQVVVRQKACPCHFTQVFQSSCLQRYKKIIQNSLSYVRMIFQQDQASTTIISTKCQNSIFPEKVKIFKNYLFKQDRNDKINNYIFIKCKTNGNLINMLINS